MPAQKTPDKGSEDSGQQRFADYLAECPSVDEPGQTASITAVGVVMRTGKEGAFALRTQDEVVHEIPVEAVESFSALASSPAARFAQLQLNPARLDADLAGRLRAGIAKQPFETLKELPTDTLAHDKSPFETVKEPPQDKQPFKDVATDPLIDKAVPKDPPHDKPPHKDIITDPQVDKPVPTDTVKEAPFDTHKEITKDHLETIKEIAKDHLETIKEIGKDPILDTFKETVADTIAETIPGIPGGPGPVVQPQFQAMAGQDVTARAMAAAAQPQLKPLQADTLKELTAETLKELGKDPIQDTLKESQFDTLKEVGGGDTWKEFVAETIKEVGKDPILDGGGNTGIADTWVEGIPGLPGGGMTLAEGGPGIPGGAGPVVQPAAGLSPFVLATPHQAPQGALAQQYLAAMAARGTLF